MSRQNLSIGLFGFGCVGKGLYDVLQHTRGLKADIRRICVKDPHKKRPLPPGYFTFDKFDILDDPQIGVIVELIDDADAAFEIVKYALQKGKGVVSANKKMIAAHFEELLALQRNYNVPFLYEGAACASIPVIRNLEEYYDNDLLTSIEGIVNGSTNYILSRMRAENKEFGEALREAQQLGFAESDPTLDIEGYDARYKLCLLATHAFGLYIKPEEVACGGITHISKADITYAREKGYRIKLVAEARKYNDRLQLHVLPKFIRDEHFLFGIEQENNAVIVEGVFSDKQFFAGKGAGSHPTASAVLSDISALTYGYRYEYKKFRQVNGLSQAEDVKLRLYCRFPSGIRVEDLPFDQIEEVYRSARLNYVVGTMQLNRLLESGYLSHPGFFIGQLENEKQQEEEQAESKIAEAQKGAPWLVAAV